MRFELPNSSKDLPISMKMNRSCFLLIALSSLYFTSVSGASAREYRLSSKYSGVKKASSATKSTKSPKSITDTFKGLPSEDLEFIRQLDQKYKQFGSNLKIKILKQNRTTSKNSKRTIDGNLGYGYSNQPQESSYQFSRPQFRIFPYSQHDIAPTRDYLYRQAYTKHSPQALESSSPQDYYQPQDIRTHTSVEVQPSRSYEIKETEHGYTTLYGDEQQQTAEYQHPYGDEQGQAVPVIVLRVPGAGKYAAHLQALLQQYLEVRAAQYLQALQEQEAHQGVLEVAQQPEAYQQQAEVQDNGALQQEYASDESQHETHEYEGTQHNVVEGAVDGYDYSKPEQQAQLVYASGEHESSSEHEHLLTTENFPDNRHTQVIFKGSTEPSALHLASAHTPQVDGVQVQTYRAPLVYHQFEQYYGNPHEYTDENNQQHSYDDHVVSVSPQNYVAVTQRPALPYNFHANIQQKYHSHYTAEGYEPGHGQAYLPPATNNLYKRSYSSRITNQPDAEDRYKKFTNLIHRLKARMTSPPPKASTVD